MANTPKKPATPPKAPAPGAKNNNKMIIIIIAVVAAVVLIPVILITILGAVIGHKVVKQTGIQVSGNGDHATIKSANGDEIATGGSQSLPKDFPSEVQVYKGNIETSARLTIEGKPSWSVVITTSDNASKVSSALTQAFTTNGWTADMDNKTADGGLIAANNGDLRVQVLYTVKDGKTSISYTVAHIAQ